MKLMKLYVIAGLALAFSACAPKKQETQILPEYKERWDTTTVVGEVIDIKTETREITLMGSKGNLMTITAGNAVERFDEISIGDVITFGNITYVKAEFREPTPEEIAQPLTIVAEAAKAPENLDPAGSLGAMVKGVVTVEALNRPFMLATVKGPQGNYLTLPVEDAALLEKLHIGQKLVLTYAEVSIVALTKL
jgi:hypothetical protein